MLLPSSSFWLSRFSSTRSSSLIRTNASLIPTSHLNVFPPSPLTLHLLSPLSTSASDSDSTSRSHGILPQVSLNTPQILLQTTTLTPSHPCLLHHSLLFPSALIFKTSTRMFIWVAASSRSACFKRPFEETEGMMEDLSEERAWSRSVR